MSQVLTRFQQLGWLHIKGHDMTVQHIGAINELLADFKDELPG